MYNRHFSINDRSFIINLLDLIKFISIYLDNGNNIDIIYLKNNEVEVVVDIVSLKLCYTDGFE